ncbi:MAG: hypothetical protein ACRC5M_06805 [Anaeroplasmataceae bacterium]
MLILSNRKDYSDINNIEKINEVKREIIIYTNNISLDSKKSKIAIFNYCVQNGSIGGVQSQKELLYSINMYFGDIIDEALFVEPSGKLAINKSALIRINDYGYVYKMVDRFKDYECTVNMYDGVFNGEYALFSNKSTDGSRIIGPSDPRFYNLDHQIVATDDDSVYFTTYGDSVCFDEIARNGGGVGYRICDLLDPKTSIRVSNLKIDDPYKTIDDDESLLDFINIAICKIEHHSLYTLASSYTVIIDKELGFNIKDMKRSFKVMDKSDEKLQIASFFEIVKEIYEDLKDSIHNIRLTVIYKESQTNVSILPIFKDKEIMNTNIPDLQIKRYVEETYNSIN